uniref:RNase H type-1 domain-containing protein n=1 Tax=Phytophthora ramorum TaxID=164328 RepID=H3HA23_PHYRM
MSTPTTSSSKTPAASATASAVVASKATTAAASAMTATGIASTAMPTSTATESRLSVAGYHSRWHEKHAIRNKTGKIIAVDTGVGIYSPGGEGVPLDYGSEVEEGELEGDKDILSPGHTDPNVGLRRPREDDSNASSSKRSRSGSGTPLAAAGALTTPRDGDDSTPSAACASRGPSRSPEESTTPPTKFEADRESSVTLDAVTQLVNSPMADMFSTGEPDESSLVPVFDRRSFVDDICFGSETFDAGLETLDRLLQRFTERRISVSFTKSIFVQPKVDFLSHEVSAEGIRADTKKMKAMTELPFPASKKGMQSFLGALNYYSRFIQDFAVYGAALYQLKDEDFTPSGSLSAAKRSFAALQQKVAEAPILRHFDRDKEVHVTLFANEWALSSTLMQYHDDKLHPVRFCGRVLKDAEMNYHPAEKEVLALLLVLKVCYSQLVDRTIHVYTRFSTLEWLLQAGLTSFVELEDSLAPVTSPTKGSPTARMDPHLLYACLPRSYTGFVMSFDDSAKTEKNGGYGSCSWILWKLPEWTVVTAASAYLETTTVNLAEYAGMNNGVSAALEHGAEDLVIVGDSRLAIQQSLGVMACRKESLMVQLNRHRELTTKLRSVKYLHVVREFNAPADSLAGEALSSKESSVASTEARKLELVELNRIGEAIYEPSVQITAEEKPTISFARAQAVLGISRDRSFFDFVRDEPDYLTATTRHQAKVRKQRVWFADEASILGPNDVAERDEANGVTTEAQNELRAEQSSNEADPGAPNAEDVGPVVIQEERRR